MSGALRHRLSFTLNACRTDVRFLDRTLRHMLRALNYPFIERLIAYDPGRPEGKYSGRVEGDDDQMNALFRGLLADGLIDRVDEVPWQEDARRALLRKYFNRDDVPKDFTGAPIHQYLYALERCTGDYILHVDSDVLFYCNKSRSWIDEAIEMMQQNPRVVLATPPGGPPHTDKRREPFAGPPANPAQETRWHRAYDVTTRYFLMDRRRLEREVLPLSQGEPGEHLERSLTHTLKMKNFERWSMNGHDNWVIHPVTHDDNFVNHLEDLIWAVENGVYPFERPGLRWDLRTEGKSIEPWLHAIAEARRNRALLGAL